MSAITASAIGEGRLTWPPEERTLGRFGSVSLCLEGNRYVEFTDLPEGALVRLSATVVKVDATIMPPDHRRRLYATVPNWGEEIDLGIGHLFVPDLGERGPVAVGLAPIAEDWRPGEWLSPTALYRAHNHHVRLEIHPCRRFDSGHREPASAA